MALLYTMVSENGIMLDRKLDDIIKSINGTYDMVSIDLQEDSIITLLEELKTLPFLDDFRVIKLTSPKFLIDSSGIDKRLIDEFISYVENPNDTTILITIISPLEYQKIKKDSKDLSKKAFNALWDKSSTTIIEAPKEMDIDKIISEEIKGYKTDVRALGELKRRVEGDPTRLIEELNKLKIYKDDTKIIKYEDVDILVSRDLEDRVYLLTSAIISSSKREALGLYSDFKKTGIMDSQILSSIISKFLELYMVKLMSQSGMSKEEVADFFHVKSGRAYYMMQDASKIRLDDIKSKYNEAVGIDYKIKRGMLDKDNALWLYLLNI